MAASSTSTGSRPTNCASAIADRDVDGVLEAMTKRNATFTARQLERALQKEIHPKIGAAAGQKHSVELERAQFANAILSHAKRRAARRPARRPDDALHDARRAGSGIACAAGGGRPQGEHRPRDRRSRVRVELIAAKYRTITPEQTRAFRHATGAEGLALIDGQAGTGKSFTMAAIREAYEAPGIASSAWRPTNKVAKNMANDGFAHAEDGS